LKLGFFGADRGVTGSNHLVEFGETKVLLDCGMYQCGKFCEIENHKPFVYDPASIAAVFVSHPHADHCGKLPKLYKDGFRGKVYCTAPARKLAQVVLEDSAKLIGREARKDNIEPLFTLEHVDGVMQHFVDLDYHTVVAIGGGRFRLLDAGHILGSAMVVGEIEGRTLVFSGDLGNSPAPLLQSTETVQKADFVIMESTYGNRLHESVTERERKLLEVILEVVQNRGVLLIPSFAIERTQELLHDIDHILEANNLGKIKVFLDSPMAIKATEIYEESFSYLSDKIKDHETANTLFNFPQLEFTESKEDSLDIDNESNPKIIIAGSGMMNGGRILSHAVKVLPNPKNVLLIVGYQSEGTLGRRLLEGERKVRIEGKEVSVQARVKAIGSYSAHADQNQILMWFKAMGRMPEKVFLVHGEIDQAQGLADKLKADGVCEDVVIPSFGEVFEI